MARGDWLGGQVGYRNDVGGKYIPDCSGRRKVDRSDRPYRLVEVRENLGERSQSGHALQELLSS